MNIQDSIITADFIRGAYSIFALITVVCIIWFIVGNIYNIVEYRKSFAKRKPITFYLLLAAIFIEIWFASTFSLIK